MNKVGITVAAILLIGAGAFLFFSGADSETANDAPDNTTSQTQTDEEDEVNEDATTDEQATATEEVTVTYQNGRFEPQTVTVTPGTTVTFVNASDSSFWPASDEHPAHNILPEFDPERALGPGEEYSFTFEQSGEWNYHNHLRASEVGTVNVAGL